MKCGGLIVFMSEVDERRTRREESAEKFLNANLTIINFKFNLIIFYPNIGIQPPCKLLL